MEMPRERLRVTIDASAEKVPNSWQTEIRQDVPLSFAHRSFTIRQVKTGFINTPKGEAEHVSLETDSEPAQS